MLVGLAAAVAAYNAAFPEDPITLVEQGCLLGGFLAYKVRAALLLGQARSTPCAAGRWEVAAGAWPRRLGAPGAM